MSTIIGRRISFLAITSCYFIQVSTFLFISTCCEVDHAGHYVVAFYSPVSRQNLPVRIQYSVLRDFSIISHDLNLVFGTWSPLGDEFGYICTDCDRRVMAHQCINLLLQPEQRASRKSPYEPPRLGLLPLIFFFRSRNRLGSFILSGPV